MIRIVLLFSFLLLGGCATNAGGRNDVVNLATGVSMVLPEKPVLGEGLSIAQLVQARYQDRHQMFQSYLQSDADHVNIIMTVPSGPRILRIVWDGHGLSETREAIAPDALDSSHIIADLMLVYAHLTDLQKTVHGAEVKEMPDGRRFLLKNGEELISIRRPQPDIWDGSARLENLSYDYVLDIQSQRIGP